MNIKLEFTNEELRIVGAALANMPYGQVAPLVQRINEQVLQQTQPPTEVTEKN